LAIANAAGDNLRMVDSPQRALGRLALRRVVVSRSTSAGIVTEPWPPSQTPYSRTLWGSFLPERRSARVAPPGGIERRRG
jgi:hypothetical protein